MNKTLRRGTYLRLGRCGSPSRDLMRSASSYSKRLSMRCVFA